MGDGGQEGRREWASRPSLYSTRADPLVTNTSFCFGKESHCPGFVAGVWGGKRGRKEVGNHPSSSWRLNPTQSCTRSPQEGSPQPGPLGRVWMSVLITRSSPVGPFRPPPSSSLSPWFSTSACVSCHLVTLARVLLIGLHRALPECLMVLSDDPKALGSKRWS